MKRILSALAVATIATVAFQSSASAAPKKPYIGPQVELNGLTGFGAIGRFPLSDDWSIRPAVTIYNGGALITGTVSYDFDTKSPLTPYVGLGYSVLTVSGFGGVASGFTGQAGVDYAISDSFDLNANLKFTGISVGAGFKF